ncbi:mucin-12-like isoform X2 [Salarias fasciatus]|uniref:mucin-12-like isoform X2 n=1 Tax=Salarias fasciatus TaxID=181472 RepID=UPI0011764BA6|nr:mucin-12-like isoform X2 [Salarias fasciatus]
MGKSYTTPDVSSTLTSSSSAWSTSGLSSAAQESPTVKSSYTSEEASTGTSQFTKESLTDKCSFTSSSTEWHPSGLSSTSAQSPQDESLIATNLTDTSRTTTSISSTFTTSSGLPSTSVESRQDKSVTTTNLADKTYTTPTVSSTLTSSFSESHESELPSAAVRSSRDKSFIAATHTANSVSSTFSSQPELSSFSKESSTDKTHDTNEDLNESVNTFRTKEGSVDQHLTTQSMFNPFLSLLSTQHASGVSSTIAESPQDKSLITSNHTTESHTTPSVSSTFMSSSSDQHASLLLSTINESSRAKSWTNAETPTDKSYTTNNPTSLIHSFQPELSSTTKESSTDEIHNTKEEISESRTTFTDKEGLMDQHLTSQSMFNPFPSLLSSQHASGVSSTTVESTQDKSLITSNLRSESHTTPSVSSTFTSPSSDQHAPFLPSTVEEGSRDKSWTVAERSKGRTYDTNKDTDETRTTFSTEESLADQHLTTQSVVSPFLSLLSTQHASGVSFTTAEGPQDKSLITTNLRSESPNSSSVSSTFTSSSSDQHASGLSFTIEESSRDQSWTIAESSTDKSYATNNPTSLIPSSQPELSVTTQENSTEKTHNTNQDLDETRTTFSTEESILDQQHTTRSIFSPLLSLLSSQHASGVSSSTAERLVDKSLMTSTKEETLESTSCTATLTEKGSADTFNTTPDISSAFTSSSSSRHASGLYSIIQESSIERTPDGNTDKSRSTFTTEEGLMDQHRVSQSIFSPFLSLLSSQHASDVSSTAAESLPDESLMSSYPTNTFDTTPTDSSTFTSSFFDQNASGPHSAADEGSADKSQVYKESLTYRCHPISSTVISSSQPDHSPTTDESSTDKDMDESHTTFTTKESLVDQHHIASSIFNPFLSLLSSQHAASLSPTVDENSIDISHITSNIKEELKDTSHSTVTTTGGLADRSRTTTEGSKEEYHVASTEEGPTEDSHIPKERVTDIFWTNKDRSQTPKEDSWITNESSSVKSHIISNVGDSPADRAGSLSTTQESPSDTAHIASTEEHPADKSRSTTETSIEKCQATEDDFTEKSQIASTAKEGSNHKAGTNEESSKEISHIASTKEDTARIANGRSTPSTENSIDESQIMNESPTERFLLTMKEGSKQSPPNTSHISSVKEGSTDKSHITSTKDGPADKYLSPEENSTYKAWITKETIKSKSHNTSTNKEDSKPNPTNKSHITPAKDVPTEKSDNPEESSTYKAWITNYTLKSKSHNTSTNEEGSKQSPPNTSHNSSIEEGSTDKSHISSTKDGATEVSDNPEENSTYKAWITKETLKSKSHNTSSNEESSKQSPPNTSHISSTKDGPAGKSDNSEESSIYKAWITQETLKSKSHNTSTNEDGSKPCPPNTSHISSLKEGSTDKSHITSTKDGPADNYLSPEENSTYKAWITKETIKSKSHNTSTDKEDSKPNPTNTSHITPAKDVPTEKSDNPEESSTYKAWITNETLKSKSHNTSTNEEGSKQSPPNTSHTSSIEEGSTDKSDINSTKDGPADKSDNSEESSIYKAWIAQETLKSKSHNTSTNEEGSKPCPPNTSYISSVKEGSTDKSQISSTKDGPADKYLSPEENSTYKAWITNETLKSKSHSTSTNKEDSKQSPPNKSHVSSNKDQTEKSRTAKQSSTDKSHMTSTDKSQTEESSAYKAWITKETLKSKSHSISTKKEGSADKSSVTHSISGTVTSTSSPHPASEHSSRAKDVKESSTDKSQSTEKKSPDKPRISSTAEEKSHTPKESSTDKIQATKEGSTDISHINSTTSKRSTDAAHPTSTPKESPANKPLISSTADEGATDKPQITSTSQESPADRSHSTHSVSGSNTSSSSTQTTQGLPFTAKEMSEKSGITSTKEGQTDEAQMVEESSSVKSPTAAEELADASHNASTAKHHSTAVSQTARESPTEKSQITSATNKGSTDASHITSTTEEASTDESQDVKGVRTDESPIPSAAEEGLSGTYITSSPVGSSTDNSPNTSNMKAGSTDTSQATSSTKELPTDKSGIASTAQEGSVDMSQVSSSINEGSSDQSPTDPAISSSFSSLSPSRPASGLSSTAKERLTDKPNTIQGVSSVFTSSSPSRLTSSLSTVTTTSGGTRPTPAPRTSTIAEKTHQSKLKFFESDNSAKDEEKKTTTSSLDINVGRGGKKEEAKAGQAVTVVVNVGGIGGKVTNESSDKPQHQAKASGAGEKVAAKQDGNQANKTKSSAAAFISQKLAEESANNSKPSFTTVALKNTDKPASQTETPKKPTEGVRGRVKLKVDPSILADLHPPGDPSRTSPSPSGRGEPRARTPERGGTKCAAEKASPADWRSMLKPVSKETKPADAPQSSPQPPPRGAGRSSLVGPSASSQLPGPSISVTPPQPNSFQNGQKDKTANGTKTESKVSKMKPDFIPKDEILKELQQIEDNLNELEKRGVDLEMKLRSSEGEGDDDSLTDELMVEWFNLIRNKQVAMRRESELVYIGRTQELEEEQPTVEQELRRLMEKPEHLKTAWDKRREEQLMAKLVEIVNDRNAIVEGLDEDRIREGEEDEQLDKMMRTFSIKKDKPAKKKSPMSKLFSWGGKKEG